MHNNAVSSHKWVLDHKYISNFKIPYYYPLNTQLQGVIIVN